MTDNQDSYLDIVLAEGDVAAERACLRCKAVFLSSGFGHRICPRCKGTASWRSAIPD